MATPILYDGFGKSGKFYVRYDLDHEGNFSFYPILLLKMGINFQKNPIGFKVMVKVKFKVIMTIEGHMKVKKPFLKIYPHFTSKID